MAYNPEQNRELTGIPDNYRFRNFLRRFELGPPENDQSLSLLIYIRNVTAQTAPQAVQEALAASSNPIDYDYFDDIWLPLHGNLQAAGFIKEYDVALRLIDRLVHCFEIGWPIGSIRGDELDWLSQMLEGNFGNSDAWCGPKNAEGFAFQENTRRDLLMRIFSYSEQWHKTRVSNAYSKIPDPSKNSTLGITPSAYGLDQLISINRDSGVRYMQSFFHSKRLIRQQNPTRGHLEHQRFTDIIDWLHKADIYGDALLCGITNNPFHDTPQGGFPEVCADLFEGVYGFRPQMALDMGNFIQDDSKPADLRRIFAWLIAYISRIQSWREDVLKALNHFSRNKEPGAHRAQYLRWWRRVDDAYSQFLRCLQLMTDQGKNPPHRIHLESYTRMQSIIQGLNALIASSKLNGIVDDSPTIGHYELSFGDSRLFPNLSAVVETRHYARTIYPDETRTDDMPPRNPLPDDDPDPRPPAEGQPGAQYMLGGPDGPGGLHGIMGRFGLGGPQGQRFPDNWWDYRVNDRYASSLSSLSSHNGITDHS
ncbi:hypothetical protein O1611_g8520 [Lasiodiplodia mahajangana]|uniref:Uncharacterized protein n=1 Tax=Lasiodiplodia mahajangana TaxID=1108764 RepID=A0ACC2JCA4_9PEZI|nr:hypothetical protein O1611_g8520 [Lasiodiplodia mahajangana]